jgi:hypothetical protein
VRKLFEVVDINNDGFISKGGEKAECMMIRQFIDID